MNSHLDRLMYAIVANPNDMTVRLAYADELEEKGDWRGEFIREQIANHERVMTCHADAEVGVFCTTEHPCPVCSDLHDAGLPWCVLGEGRYRIQRGFVESVACTIADWTGESCQRCNGTGKCRNPATVNPVSMACSDCQGTGRVSAHGPAVVLAAPIREVRLSDREPFEVEEPIRGQFWLVRDEEVRNLPLSPGVESSVLPHVIYDRLTGGYESNSHGLCRGYATEQEAWQDCSAACIAWAREQAKLPAIHN